MLGCCRPGRQAGYIQYRTYFDCPFLRAGNACGHSDRFGEVLGVDHKVAAQVFSRFGEWAIGYGVLSTRKLDALAFRGGVKSLAGQPAVKAEYDALRAAAQRHRK